MFERIIATDHCPPGHRVFVRHHDLELAVFHLEHPDRYVVSDNRCPHAGGNLSAGTLHRAVVLCPLHRWKFNLLTGHCVGTHDVFLRRYACQVQGPDLLVDVSQPLPIPPPPRRDF